MKKITLLALTALAAIAISACIKPPAGPNPETANTNSAKPAAKPPTTDELVAMENKAFEAWKNKDGKFFDNFLADNFVGLGPTGRVSRADAIKSITDNDCVVKSISFSEPKMTTAGPDAAILTLKANQDYTCGGKKQPADTWSATIYVRKGDQWKAIYHNEIPVGGAKPEGAAPPPTTASPAGSPAAETKSADTLTTQLMAAEKQGWDGWKNRDAKALEAIVTGDFILIAPNGERYDKAGALKAWTEPKCEVKSVALADGSGVSLGTDAGLLTYKGSADGTCEGTKLTDLWGTTVFVKSGDTWKAVFILEQPV
jgi:hypothetical protein